MASDQRNCIINAKIWPQRYIAYELAETPSHGMSRHSPLCTCVHSREVPKLNFVMATQMLASYKISSTLILTFLNIRHTAPLGSVAVATTAELVQYKQRRSSNQK